MSKGLILAPGLDTWLAEFSIKEIRPDYIAFLATEATNSPIQSMKESRNPMTTRNFFIKNIFSTVETVQEFLNALQWLVYECGADELWIDATNCITVIEMATYTSASLIDIFKEVLDKPVTFNLVYVHSDYTVKEDGVAAEIRGTERLVELEKPIDTLSFVLALESVQKFNEQRYEQSAEDFLMLAKNTTGEKSLLYEGLTLLAESYGFWDKLQIQQATERLETARVRLGKVKEYDLVKELLDFIPQNTEALHQLKNESETAVILDLYTNALRRMNEGRFDDGIARFYACLERITQYQLKTYGIVSNKPQYSKLDSKIVKEFEKKIGFLPSELELKKNVVLLLLLQDQIGKEIEVLGYETFLGLISIRNNSMLAHGTRPVTDQHAKRFKEKLMDPLLKKFVSINSIDENDLQKHSHMKIRELSKLLMKRMHSPLRS
ncbi:MAG: TIGR02710 family CRISPR-associated protein [Candidatus Aenigmarchaeota archaeon]|nr:TIGR02710 family CRISPR-associated protein [Candidatus Aenigmarchaeota archaeon]